MQQVARTLGIAPHDARPVAAYGPGAETRYLPSRRGDGYTKHPTTNPVEVRRVQDQRYCMPGVCGYCLRWTEGSGDVFCAKTGMFVQVDYTPTGDYLGCQKEKRPAVQREPLVNTRKRPDQMFHSHYSR